MGRKHGVGKKEPGGLAPCSICGAVIYPTPWQVPVQGESSWFLLVSERAVQSPFPPLKRGGGQQPCWVHCCQIAENFAKSSNIEVEKNYLRQEIGEEL